MRMNGPLGVWIEYANVLRSRIVDAVSAITAMAACLGARINAIPPFGLGRSEHQLEP